VQTANITYLRSHTYEITFVGHAANTLRAAFDDCTVTAGPGTTTLSVDLPDQAVLWGLVQRIIGFGLEVVELHLVTPSRSDMATSGQPPYSAARQQR
jgi:hypothetical protein